MENEVDYLLKIYLYDAANVYIDYVLYGKDISRKLREEYNNKYIPLYKNRILPKNQILALADLKYCSACEKVLDIENFRKNSTMSDVLQHRCKSCHYVLSNSTQKARKAKRKSSLLNRIPKWANIEKIKEIYNNCPNGYQVDHIIPLQGKIVSGLHVESNLQYLTILENQKKSNKF